ncbi:MAG: twin-arginine translocase TatA/TatE family subunit [Micromonosporaceae bacterium]|nr:twin-arginine translocase TatA/TatE family subunit [Micromonosporaceae bacterium]
MGWIENLGGWELILIILIGLFIFGPDRLPKAIGDGVKMLRQLRTMARNATGDLSRELGTDIELEDLHPKTFLRKHLLSEEDERALRKPLESAFNSIKDDLRQVSDTAKEITSAVNEPAAAPASVKDSSRAAAAAPAPAPSANAAASPPPAGPASRPAVDFDAT